MRVTRHAYAVDGWGVGELWEAEGLVVAHEAPSGANATPTPPAPTPPKGAASPPSGTLAGKPSYAGVEFVPELLRRIRRFYGGEPVDFGDVRLDLAWCTPFQADVAAALRRVPWGEIVSYGELAERAGYPRAHRAAGTFCAENRFSLFLPCHRVVAADGIGSYGALGVSYKRRLLRLEGHAAL